MYNRYIPEDMSYTPIETPSPQRPRPSGDDPRQTTFRFPELIAGKEGLSRLLGGREKGGLSGLMKNVRLDRLDSGDILLLLIALYLLAEGDDPELAIALGLAVFLGLEEEN